MERYNPAEIEKKWQEAWEKNPPQKAEDFGKKPKYYALVEFPYLSGDGLHMGHAFTFTIADVYARMKSMQGHNVLFPIGWDAFGLPTENYAVKTGIKPQVVTENNRNNFRRQMKMLGLALDWSREFGTSNPDYYKWTQWIFLQLFKHGLAYKAETKVGWCPKCKIVLAQEEVVGGKCERCGTVATEKMQKQWVLRITNYADRLDFDLDGVDYPEYIKISQRNWIGRKEGTKIKFKVQEFEIKEIEVFTTRPDTIFGVTFIALAPDHELVRAVAEGDERVRNYVGQDRSTKARGKTGLDTGIKAVNPVTNEEVPVWVADYVLSEAGTGAIMGVPAHDERDFEFAKEFGLEIKTVVVPTKKSAEADLIAGNVSTDPDLSSVKSLPYRNQTVNPSIALGVKGMDPGGVEPPLPNLTGRVPHRRGPILESVYTGEGVLVNSGQFSEISSGEARERIMGYLEEKGWGKRVTTYHLRDWIFSRQHYWGEPIPMVYCDNCARKGITWWKTEQGSRFRPLFDPGAPSGVDNTGRPVELAGWMPIDEGELPLKLPEVERYQPTETGESPLANIPGWTEATCPNCHGPARRETDTMPNWAGSSWYFLRYCDRDNKSSLADRKKLDYWLPVDMYFGGAEHTTLHVLYSRFWHKFLNDINMTPGKEPYAARRQHGMILAEGGAKMSKSKGNVINPDHVVEKYGSDAVRVYVCFMGPYDQTMPWSTRGVEGAVRFLNRVWGIYHREDKVGESTDPALAAKLAWAIGRVTTGIAELRQNTGVAALMEFLNSWETGGPLSKADAEIYLKLVAPFAPHLAEELWQLLESGSVHKQSWPEMGERIKGNTITSIVVTINGKPKGTISISNADLSLIGEKELFEKAKSITKVSSLLKDKPAKRVVYVPGRVLNIVP